MMGSHFIAKGMGRRGGTGVKPWLETDLDQRRGQNRLCWLWVESERVAFFAGELGCAPP
jgi:hypothetical protein